MNHESILRAFFDNACEDIARRVADKLLAAKPEPTAPIRQTTKRGSMQDICKTFKTTPPTVRRMIKAGTLPYSKVGRKYLFDMAAVEESLRGRAGS